MRHRGEFVYTKQAEKQIDALTDKIDKLDRQKEIFERQIRAIECGQSPIKPGQIIEWQSGERLRRGKVISVSACSWKGFTFRCHVLSKAGKEIGYANVDPDRFPTLAGQKQ